MRSTWRALGGSGLGLLADRTRSSQHLGKQIAHSAAQWGYGGSQCSKHSTQKRNLGTTTVPFLVVFKGADQVYNLRPPLGPRKGM